jgi:hypothetical protein
MTDRFDPADASSPEAAVADPGSAGLCAGCVHARAIVTRRGSTFVLCEASLTDRRLERYPRLPVLRCHGFEPEPTEDSGSR